MAGLPVPGDEIDRVTPNALFAPLGAAWHRFFLSAAIRRKDTVSAVTTRIDQSTTTSTLYVASELGEKDWKLAMSTSLHDSARIVRLRARDTHRACPLDGSPALFSRAVEYPRPESLNPQGR